MRHLHGAVEHAILGQATPELQFLAKGNGRSGPHANSRLTHVDHRAGDRLPALLELAITLDNESGGLSPVGHALTLRSPTADDKASPAAGGTLALPVQQWREGKLQFP
jgi:hypothetical protein